MRSGTKFVLSLATCFALAACGSSSGGTDTQTSNDLGSGTDASDTLETIADNGVSDPGVKSDIPAKTDKGTLDDTGTPQDQGQTDLGQPPEGSCPEIATCAMLCDTVACKEQCLTTAGDGTKAVVLAMADCLEALNCGPLVGPGGFVGCAIDACADEIAACYAGTGVCNDIRKCRIDCPTLAGDYSCALMCFAEGSKEAQDLFQNYADCIYGKEVECSETDIKSNGWPIPNCEKFAQSKYCPLQTQACIPPH
ncbi:MAG: hypothetical protein GXP54_13375 [Deltaproteobacteria bacterium]|nr:hypothetical protein [Deltaproteobacteria bacterium]